MPRPTRALPLPEFVAMAAMIMGSIAFSVDAMLPALGEIAEELVPGAPNRAQLILTSFILGMGAGTLIAGPLADRFGRRPVILCGFALYMAMSAWAWAAASLEAVLVARVLQGMGAAGPRVAMVATIRDLFEGRRMAQIMSFVMMVFTLVPAAAPLMGAGLIALTGWRGIFLAFVVWGLAMAAWYGLRQPETLPPDRHRPLRPRALAAGIAEALSSRHVVVSIAVLTLCFGILFATLSTVQPVFDVTFGRAELFPWFFAAISLIAAGGSALNARIVVVIGMRAVVRWTLRVELALSAALAWAVLHGGLPPEAMFWIFVIWTQSVFAMAGLTIGNLNALGMEPLGHMAGLGASIIASVATVGSLIVAVPVGLAFDGTPLSLALGAAGCCAAGLALMRLLGPESAPEPALPPDPDLHP